MVMSDNMGEARERDDFGSWNPLDPERWVATCQYLFIARKQL